MLARIQRLIVLVLLMLICAGAVFAMREGSAIGVLALPAAITISYASAIALEFVLLRRSYAPRDPLRPGLAQVLRAWCAEVAVAPQVFLWRQPFRSNAIRDFIPHCTRTSQRGVVLVHGFACNRGLWNPWSAALRAAGVPFVALTLEPVFGSIDAYVGPIDEAVARLARSTGFAPVLVAHSMGGLAARAWWTRCGQNGERAHRIVTMGTPHRGTLMAGHSRTTNVRQMRIDSAWLAELTRTETAAMRERFTCFWSHCDNIVFPTRLATLEGADNRHLPLTPHVRMVYHPEVFAEVMRLVDVPARR